MIIGICDDIPEYVNQITQIVKEYFNNNPLDYSIKQFSSGSELLDCNDNIDILLLDIELGDSNAIDLIKAFGGKYRSTLIIIVTSYQHYLDKAMDLEILRYIDKPINTKRVFDALDRAIDIFNNSKIVIRAKDGVVYNINKADIVYIESYLRQVTIYTRQGKIITNTPLKEIRNMISTTSYFAYPHYSFIINLNYILLITQDNVKLRYDDKEALIPISSRNIADFKNAFLNYSKEGYNFVKNDH